MIIVSTVMPVISSLWTDRSIEAAHMCERYASTHHDQKTLGRALDMLKPELYLHCAVKLGQSFSCLQNPAGTHHLWCARKRKAANVCRDVIDKRPAHIAVHHCLHAHIVGDLSSRLIVMHSCPYIAFKSFVK